jgi:hypothetical protein
MFGFHGMDETGETEASFVCYPNVVEKFYDLVQVVGSFDLTFHGDFRTHSLRTFSFRSIEFCASRTLELNRKVKRIQVELGYKIK